MMHLARGVRPAHGSAIAQRCVCCILRTFVFDSTCFTRGSVQQPWTSLASIVVSHAHVRYELIVVKILIVPCVFVCTTWWSVEVVVRMLALPHEVTTATAFRPSVRRCLEGLLIVGRILVMPYEVSITTIVRSSVVVEKGWLSPCWPTA